ncbi:MAG: hypothetical protein JSV65_15695, partial [Armatimonadota bacterium]
MILRRHSRTVSTWLARIAFATVATGCVVPAAAAPAEPSYLERIGEGIDLLRGDTPRQAEDAFVAANLQDYSDPLGWIGLGAARLGRGYVDRAMADFAQAAHLAARGSAQARAVTPLAQFGRAICLLQRGEVHAAAEELEALA